MKRFGPFTHYGWGWDIGPLFGWWLVYSTCENRYHLYISSDATPPCDDNRGVTLFARYRPDRIEA